MKIILSENQIQSIIRQQLIENQLINEGNMGMLEKSIYSLMFMGLLSVETLYQYLQHNPYIPEQQKEIIIQDAEDFEEYQEKEMWREIANDAIITVYNAVPAQCNADCGTTASGFKLNLNNVASHKIVAMERTFMKEFGLKYGDVIKIEGTYKGAQDGVYQIQDTMNKRFAGQHKVDVLVPNNIRTGGTLKNQPAKIYVLNDKNDTVLFNAEMSPSLKKKS